MDEAARSKQIDLDFLPSVLNAVNEGISVQDAGGALIWVNDTAAQLAGFDCPDQMLAATPEELFARFQLFEGSSEIPMDLRRLPGRLALLGEHPPEVLVRWITRDTGAERWSLIRARPVLDEEGKVLYAVNVFRDVTDRQLAVRSLEHANDSLEQANNSLEHANDSLEQVNNSLEHANNSLQRVNSRLELANKDLQVSEQRYARLYEERALAAQTLSEALLPSKLPAVQFLEIDASFRPAAQGVGGDFYDVVRLVDGRWLLVIADVAGKGAPAAALTAMARYTLRTLARTHCTPSELLEAVNLVLTEDFAEGKFCSMAAAAVRPAEAFTEVSVVVAGHPLPLVQRASGEVVSCGITGMPLGIFTPLELQEAHLTLEPGDTLVMVTDGCVGEGAESRAVLGPFLSGLVGQPVSELVAAVQSKALQVQREHRDDSAVLAARRL